MSKIEVTIQLNKGRRPDKGHASRMFNKFLSDINIGTGDGTLSNMGTMYKFRAENVTGVDIDSLVTVAYRPDKQAGVTGNTRIQIFRHTDGPAGAAREAAKLAKRIADAYHLQMGKGTTTSKRRADCILDIPTIGWNGEFQEILAEYTPRSATH
jgi:hypothetical protein